MNCKELISELSRYIDAKLAEDLVLEFLEIRNDLKADILGRASCGKFIETVVQVLQYLNDGNYDTKPNVDAFLKNLESINTNINDDLKICCTRIARSCYTLRNKRNILHKGAIDSNIYDLRYIYSACQWILSEFVRQLITNNMKLAGKIIDYIQLPVSQLIEDFGNRKIIFGKFRVEDEILLLLNSYYPEYVSSKIIRESLDRRATSSISTSLKKLWSKKYIHNSEKKYKLTQLGINKALDVLKSCEISYN